MKYVIGNWKSNNTVKDALIWLEKFAQLYIPTDTVKTILAPGYMHIPVLANKIQELKLRLELAGQDLSPFDKGAHTGEICASQLAEYAKYSLVGHSERRSQIGETDTVLAKKVHLAKTNGIEPIFCVQSINTPIPDEVSIVAYEPVEAIGSGHADSPSHANDTLGQIKKQHPFLKIGIYGGSVKPDNAASLTNQPHIDGVLPGGASLKPDLFAEIIKNVSKT